MGRVLLAAGLEAHQRMDRVMGAVRALRSNDLELVRRRTARVGAKRRRLVRLRSPAVDQFQLQRALDRLVALVLDDDADRQWHVDLRDDVGPFDPQTGAVHKASDGPPSYTQVFGDTLVELAQQNERVVAITAAMLEGTGLKSFSEAFPERFYDVGIA